MMEGDDIVIGQLPILFIEGVDEMHVLGDRWDDDDVSSGKSFLIESFTEELGIESQGIFDQIPGEWIRFDEIIGLVPILDDTVVLVHLFQCTHAEIEGLDAMIESILDLDRFAAIFRDIEQYEIIFLEVIPQEEHGMERLRKDGDILDLEKIPVDGIEGIQRSLMEIDDIEPEKDLPCLTDGIFLLFAVDMHIIEVDHDSLAIDHMMPFRLLAFFIDDALEVVEREFLVGRQEDIEPEEWESALVEHEIVMIFRIF